MIPVRPAVWFPAVKTGSGTDVFTEVLVHELNARGIKAEIAWLPKMAEYAPWLVRAPLPPSWVNIIHTNSWIHGKFYRKGLPVVVTVHSCVHDEGYSKYKSLLQKLYHKVWIKRCEKASINSASIVTAVSRDTANQTKKVFTANNIKVIGNSVDTGKFRPPDKVNQHIPFRLLFVGSTTRRKGFDLFPHILEKLGSDFEFWFTGTSGDLNWDSGDTSSTTVLPLGKICNSEELVKIYQSCDAFLFPTRLEGLSLAALEAQSCGLPIITANTSSMPEIVEHNVTGILCNNDAVDEYVRAAYFLKNNRDIWENMTNLARKNAEKYYNPDRVIDEYRRIYENILLKGI